ncbi:WcbI family polysaccharide biosynthesis putative acetyltransferase [Butyrivibrio sp. VCD2006]|uniref:WcbI family polysaccharide biosynthesis putative acetyltransferase n=1 Tax=Butyrivibrio sp. VCD2006 TaxID=1280664 RepID=UPI000429AAFC|nr:WcbI family polysaccharide biosynthesis putative acetyltransferase [Butyrivibrio sp. VCD2006]
MKNLLKENHKIILWGCGNTAREFYAKYGNSLNIIGFLSNNVKEKVFSPDNDIIFEVKRPVPKCKEGLGDLIIICSIAKREIEEQLMLLGYEPFVDFIDFQMAAQMLANKEIALFYGVCHLRAIKEALMTSKVFSDSYEAFFVANYFTLSAYDVKRLEYLSKNCKLFIYGQSMDARDYRMNQTLMVNLGKNVTVLAVPVIAFGTYFSQIKRPFNRMNRFAVKCEGYDYTPFSYEDSFINQCIDEGLSTTDIIRKVTDENVYDRDKTVELFTQELKRIKFQESTTDISISDYIKDNYQKIRLFRNEAHMENEVVYQYASQILHKIGMPVSFDIQSDSFFFCSQHLIYPCAAEALGLEWDVTKEKLSLYTYKGWRIVSFQEYLMEYIEYCTKIREMKYCGLLPE